MKRFFLAGLVGLMLCQCENVASPSARRASLVDSGLSPAERVRAAKHRPLSTDPGDPLSKVRAVDSGVAVSVLQF